MVMFREDDERMKEAARAAEPRWKKRLRRLVKIALWTGFLLGITLTALSMQAGNSDALKRGLEDYLGHATGFQAEIGELKYMAFFPVLGVAMNELSLYRSIPQSSDAPPLRAASAITAGQIVVAISFLDVLTGRRRIRALDLQDIILEPGVLGQKKITLSLVRLDKAAYAGGPGIVADGMYGGEPLKASLALEPKGKGLALPENAGFTLRIGPLQFDGTIKRQANNKIMITLNHFGYPETPFSGTMVVTEDKKRMHLVLDLRRGEAGLRADIHQMDESSWTGSVSAHGGPSSVDLMLALIGYLDFSRFKGKLELDGGSGDFSWEHNTLSFKADQTAPGAGLLDPALQGKKLNCFTARIGKNAVSFDPAILETDTTPYSGKIVFNNDAVSFQLNPVNDTAKGCVLP